MSLSSALVSALVGFLFAPYMHVLISRTPMHLALRNVDLHCSNCGTKMRRGQRNAIFARIHKDHICHSCLVPLWRDSPWVEVATTIIFAIVGLRLGWGWALPAYWAFFFAATAIAIVDYRHYIIPTRIVYPTALIGLVLLFIASVINGSFDRFGDAVLAMIFCWLFYYLTFLFFPAGMGFGDVRLALLVGLFSGWLGIGNALWAVILGLFLGAGVGLLLVVVRVRKLKSHIPFGPFMIVGASFAILFLGSLLPNA